MSYCVYVHKRRDTFKVFYVGMAANKRRPTSGGSFKTKNWKNINDEAGGHSVEILHDNLTRQEALDIENKYLEAPPVDWELVNVAGPRGPLKYDKIEWNQFFTYDPSVRGCLRWKNGDVAGNFNAKGRHRVRFKNRYYLGYRIVFAMFNENFDTNLLVNHIDGDTYNSKIENLELVSFGENVDRGTIFKGNLAKHNSSGHTNIREIRRRGGWYLLLQYKTETGVKSKQFNLKILEYPKALDLALDFQRKHDVRFTE